MTTPTTGLEPQTTPGWNPLAAPLRLDKCRRRNGHNRRGIQWIDWLPNGRAHCQECGGRIKSEDGRRPKPAKPLALPTPMWLCWWHWLVKWLRPRTRPHY
jgi:hypothetical protein